MNNIKLWGLFCEDVRIEHDQRCTLVGVTPSVALDNEVIILRQLCLVYSSEMPRSLSEISVSHTISYEGNISGLQDNFLHNTNVYERPEAMSLEDTWQVITYSTSDRLEITAPAKISARIEVGDSVYETELKFFRTFD